VLIVSNFTLIFYQFKLADMEARIQSSRLLTWQAACMMDAGQNYTKVLYHLCFMHIHDTAKSLMN
jgi:alkylation response protein AidB-like acyl-CoA dehydrogenase